MEYPFSLPSGSTPLGLHWSQEGCSWNDGTRFETEKTATAMPRRAPLEELRAEAKGGGEETEASALGGGGGGCWRRWACWWWQGVGGVEAPLISRRDLRREVPRKGHRGGRACLPGRGEDSSLTPSVEGLGSCHPGRASGQDEEATE